MSSRSVRVYQSLLPGLYKYPDSATIQKWLPFPEAPFPNHSISFSFFSLLTMMTVFLLSIRRPLSYSMTSNVGIECFENFKRGSASISTIMTPLLAFNKAVEHSSMFSRLKSGLI